MITNQWLSTEYRNILSDGDTSLCLCAGLFVARHCSSVVCRSVTKADIFDRILLYTH